MSSPPKNNSQHFVKHSKPIPIGTARSRRRSASTSSSSDSSTSPSEPQTPLNNTTPPRMVPTNLSPSNSPILSYFMTHSPTKSATFPFNRNFPGRPPVFEGLLLVMTLHAFLQSHLVISRRRNRHRGARCYTCSASKHRRCWTFWPTTDDPSHARSSA